MFKTGKKKLILFFVLVLGIILFYKSCPLAGQSYKYIKLLVDIIKIVKENYVEEISEQKLVYGAARGVVSELDGFSAFMEPKVHKRVSGDIEGEFGGVGIVIAPGSLYGHRYVEVLTPVPGSPAYDAGVLPRDKIVKIEGRDTLNMSVSDAADMLRGKKGTKVSFTILRQIKDKSGQPKNETKEFTLKRAIIPTQVMQARVIDGEIGYIHLDDFSGHTVEKVEKQLKEFEKKGIKSLILDLRYNPGGLLFAAIDLVKFFIGEDKMIVYTKGRKTENYQEFKADSKASYGEIPLVVLVNGGSASGSEIVAGALQDHKRALIIGSRTFGKGNVQSVIPLSDGSGLSLTIAKYYTPSGKSIHRSYAEEEGGIKPDIEIEVDPETAFKIFQQYTVIYTPGKKPSSGVSEKDKTKDEVLNRAIEALKARKVFLNSSGGKSNAQSGGK